MTGRHPARFVLIAAAVGVLASLATPPPAVAGDERWQLRIFGLSVTPDITLDMMGADVRLGDGPWSIGVSANHLDTNLKVSNAEDPGADEVDVDPFLVGLGVGYRF